MDLLNEINTTYFRENIYKLFSPENYQKILLNDVNYEIGI